MSEVPNPVLSLDNFEENLTGSFAPGFAAVDDYIDQHLAAWLPGSSGENLSQLLSGAGFTTQQWGEATFAKSAESSGGQALLIYLPDTSEINSLKAALLAVSAWQTQLPATLKVLAGPVDAALLEAHAADLAANAIIYDHGEYFEGLPMFSLGLKGLLEVELRVRTLTHSAPSAYAEIMPAASWTIIRAMDSIKSDSQEVKIENFEEDLEPLPYEEIRYLLDTASQHAGRLVRRREKYGLKGYIFDLKDSLVLQTEYLVPTVNISAIECGTMGPSGHLKLPSTARAQLDFHLVPGQHPERIFEHLYAHLTERDFEGLEVIQLPGAQLPARTPMAHPFVQSALQAAQEVAGIAPLLAPISSSSGPLAMLKAISGDAPAICAGFGEEVPDEKTFGTHTRIIARLLAVAAELQPQEEAPDLPEPVSFEENPAIITSEEFLVFELPPEVEEINGLAEVPPVAPAAKPKRRTRRSKKH
ncbi:MAG TPA: peptidase dimerization domain-containing protein [Chloroflexia bacterium]|nr:peptidase dimerization domain-containing protein [Chloroflexia bacterium]